MNKISNAIKCVNCMSVLDSPVLLPCSHSICKSHVVTVTSKEKIVCHKCEKEHDIPANGFPTNDAIAQIIEAQIEKLSLGFGPTHVEAKYSCEQLEEFIYQLEHRLNDPSSFIYEEIGKMKNKVHLKSEQLKERIDQEVDKLITKLNECYMSCEENLKRREIANEFKRLENVKSKSQSDLAEWIKSLNEINFDEAKWKEIKKASDKQVRIVQENTKSLEFEMTLSNFAEANFSVDYFLSISIDPVFAIKNVQLESEIVHDTQKLKLFDLCGFDYDQKFNLLYRGSKDGFKARNFHFKCDFKPETLTLIRTSLGNVFGGFTEALWDQSCTYKSDPNAFLFSLVNQENHALKMKIREGGENKAIYCSPCGPIFGSGHDFAIFFHSDTVICFSHLSSTYEFTPNKSHKHCSSQRKCFLIGSGNCEVMEIEVFQKV